MKNQSKSKNGKSIKPKKQKAKKQWVVMINDCAYDGRDIVYELKKENFPIVHILRTRSLWDKTFNIALKIFRAKGALYHVNYALQDALLTIFLKKMIGRKPVIVQCPGSDLRWETTTTQKYYQRIIKFNVTHADQVFYNDPDISKKAKELSPTAIWLPIPTNLDVFYPKDIPPSDDTRLKAFYPNALSERIRGSLSFIKAFNIFAKQYENAILDVVKWGPDLLHAIRLCEKAGTLNKKVRFIPKIDHYNMAETYRNHDLTVGVFQSGIVPSVGLESWAVKRPLLNYINSKLYPPFERISVRTIDKIVDALHQLSDAKTRDKLANAGYKYVLQYHDSKKLAQKVKKVYNRLLEKN